jgi:hypothetical protein
MEKEGISCSTSKLMVGKRQKAEGRRQKAEGKINCVI